MCPTAIGVLAIALARPCHGEPSSAPRADRYELGVLPVVAGDTDVGVKLGAFGQVARFQRDLNPYAWRAQLLGAASVRQGPSGTELPYREGMLALDWPLAGSLRLLGQMSYQQTTNYGYYGLGNASHAERLWAGLSRGTDEYVRARHFYQFDGATSQVRLGALERLAPRWNRFSGATLSHDVIRPYPGSLLAREKAAGGQRLYGAETQTRLLLALGVAYDSRNHETVTTAGHFHEFSLRASPGAFGVDPYLGVNLTLRGYVAILGERFSLGARLVGDALSRRAPLFELGRYGGLYAAQGPGGSRGIRGVPQGRLLGRSKLVGNLEARSLFLPFFLAKERFTLGAAAFFDAGRVWTDTFRAVGALDGPVWRLHWGVGAGPRLRWGDALLIRADFAYAPLGAELGVAPAVYVDVDQVL
jgi:hypothetical protein